MHRRSRIFHPISLLVSIFSIPFFSAQSAVPSADESSIVPLSYKIVGIELESRISPTTAAVRFTKEGVNYSEDGDRSAYPFLHPLQGQDYSVSREFGMVKDGPDGKEYFHPGLDFAASEGIPVIASASGKVERSGYTAGYGLFMVINHGSFSSLYGHLHKNRLVKKGDSVSAGQRIGSVGSTGETTGALLHYEIRLSRSKSGVLYSIDPGEFLDLARKAGNNGSAATLAYGADVVKPQFSFKEGNVTLTYGLAGNAHADRGSPEDFPLRDPLGSLARKLDTGFGLRVNPFSKKKEFHTGVDIVCYWGCPVYAAGAGEIAKTGYESGYGNYVIIRHGKLVSLYSHLKDLANLSVGKKVSAGQRIGQIGNTGMTTGPHLHYEIRLVTDMSSGFKESVKQLFDPLDFLNYGDLIGK